MILVDTNVLVALTDPCDGHHRRAARDLRRAQGSVLLVTEAVLSESCFLIPGRAPRRRLRFLLGALAARLLVLDEPWQEDLFDWLDQHATHEPDFTDAQLVLAASREMRRRVWTYDGEFRTTWRRLDGSRIPLFGAVG